jgi:hypothetical protein
LWSKLTLERRNTRQLFALSFLFFLAAEVRIAAARGQKGIQIMDRASIVILERTLELATELMSEDVRVGEYLDVIRIYLESPEPDSEKQLQHAVAELLTIARQNQQFLIAIRLQAFMRQP